MKRAMFLGPAVAVAALAAAPLLAAPASAAPLPAPAQVDGSNLAQPVACWWRNGRRFCDGYVVRRHGYYGYGRSYGYRPSYGHARPEELRFGSTEWWRAMDREGRGGYRR